MYIIHICMYIVCGAKYKTRAGLVYHFTHAHKDPAPASDGDSRDSARAADAHTPPAPTPASSSAPAPAPAATPAATAHGAAPATEYQDSYVTFLNNPAVAAATPAGNLCRPVSDKRCLDSR